jgi:hypothetical protein
VIKCWPKYWPIREPPCGGESAYERKSVVRERGERAKQHEGGRERFLGVLKTELRIQRASERLKLASVTVKRASGRHIGNRKIERVRA